MDKRSYSKDWKSAVVRGLFFLVVAVAILLGFPREGKFKYQFSEGKPWRYELLTASFDFPIYKSNDLLEKERDSVMTNYKPYFKLNGEVAEGQVAKLRADYESTLRFKSSPATMRYVETCLREVYSKGVVDNNDLNLIRDGGYESVMLVVNNIGRSVLSGQFLSIKQAYQMIVDEAPKEFDRAELLAINIDQYISDNVEYDESRSEQAEAALLQSVSPSKGMVQTGEKIIDRGEIVTPHIYEILESFRIVSERKSEFTKQHIWVVIGQSIIILSLFLSLFFYLYLFRPKLLERKANVAFILTMILGIIGVTELVTSFQLFNVYIIPYTILPILIRTFFDSRTALFAHNVTVLICSFMTNTPFEFVLLQIAGGMTAIHSLKDLTQRSQLVKSAMLIVLTYSLVYVGDNLIVDGDWKTINGLMFVYFAVNGILIMFSYLLMYMVERVFGYTSNVTLVELSNINNPIFRRFSENCPGTFQHTLQVSNLAAEAANEIGAYAQLARTGALYHDIGKLDNPGFFTENQLAGDNPHDKMSYDSSARIIIDHVSNGMRIAEKLGLPKAIKGFIYTHHGTSKTKYFYNSFMNENPDAKVDEANFTYPGPTPYSKETAIVMMADSVEATSRSLPVYNEETITNMVNNIVNSQLADGQFNNAPITLKEIERVKSVFINKLLTIHHSRISYPKLKTEEENRKREVPEDEDSERRD